MADTGEKIDDRETGEFVVADRKIMLYRPSVGQMLVIMTLLDLEDEEDQQQQIEMVLNFGTVIRTCFTDPDDRRWVLRGLADNTVSIEQYMELAHDIIAEFEPEKAANRAERRAPAKKAAPAKRVSARARR